MSGTGAPSWNMPNEQKVKEADLKVKQLELDTFRKSLSETQHTLEDAQCVWRKAILDFHQYAGRIAGGRGGGGSRSESFPGKCERLRVQTDYSDRIAAGARAMVTGHERLEGGRVTPLSVRRNHVLYVQDLDDRRQRPRSAVPD